MAKLKPKKRVLKRVLLHTKPKASRLSATELKAVAARCAESGKANEELKKFVAAGRARLNKIPA